MGGGHGIFVETLAVGGAFALVFGAVIRSHAGFVVAVWIDGVSAGATGQEREEGAGAEQTFHFKGSQNSCGEGACRIAARPARPRSGRKISQCILVEKMR